MFHQNSNDLVKQASVNTQHSQNSYQTSNQLIKNLNNQFGPDLGDNAHVISSHSTENHIKDTPSDASSISNIFTAMVKDLFKDNKMDVIEGNDTSSTSSSSVKPQTIFNSAYGKQHIIEGLEGKTATNTGGNAVLDINSISDQNNKHIAQENANNQKLNTIRSIISNDESMTRNNWVEVVDKSGVSRYGYITKDNIFQVWYIPTNPSNNPVNWFTNEPIKNNNNVLGCPRFSSSITKIQITVKWDELKPFEPVFSKFDNKTPVFIMTESGIRDINRSYKKSGLFSCGNESTNVAVKERPAADFDFDPANGNQYKQGCFVLKPGKTIDKDILTNGFKKQEDLGKTSISKCKRRAEDLGRTFFFMAENDAQAKNKADCYIYTVDGVPSLETIVSLDDKNTMCYNVNAIEAEEDEYMKQYEHTLLPRLYGTSVPYTTKTLAKCPPGYNSEFADPNNNNYCTSGWSESCGESCRKQSCIDNGGKWIPLDYRYNAYTCQMAEPKVNKQSNQGIALYSLKSNGPSGVDTLEAEKPGLVGKIAFITHNGERREYPKEFLKKDTGVTMKMSDVAFMEVGNYDTRSKTDNYGANGPQDNGIDNITFEECKKRCVENKNSGGFVFTGSKSNGVGKCQLKHKDKMFPIGLRESDPTKILMLKLPAIQDSISSDCRTAGQIQKDGNISNSYNGVNSMQYAYYLDGGFMKNDTKCDVTKFVTKVNDVSPVDGVSLAKEYNKQVGVLGQQVSSLSSSSPAPIASGKPTSSSTRSTDVVQGFTLRTLREGNSNPPATPYVTDMSGVSENISKIGNATRKQETINAFNSESNMRLIAESYKFILWAILAILAVIAVIKLKEKITDSVDDDTVMTAISSLGASINLDDIGDKTESVKNSLNSGIDEAKTGISSAMNNVTEQANNAVASAQEGVNNLNSGISNFGNKMTELTGNITNNMNPSNILNTSGSSSANGNPGLPSRGGRLRRK
jgi:hypothetical protein